MRTPFIVLSIIVSLCLIEYSNAAPRKARSLENDELNQMMKKVVEKFKPILYDDDEEEENSAGESRESNDDDDNNEKKTIIQGNDDSEKSEEDNDLDKDADSSQYIDIDDEKVANESDDS